MIVEIEEFSQVYLEVYSKDNSRLRKIANSLYRISLQDTTAWNRKAKIIRFMNPKLTQAADGHHHLEQAL
jgi:hypothetical protein